VCLLMSLVFVGGTFSSSAFGRERDKTFRGQRQESYRPPSSSLSAGPSSSYGNGGSGTSPAHRIQPQMSGAISSGREQLQFTTSSRISGQGSSRLCTEQRLHSIKYEYLTLMPLSHYCRRRRARESVQNKRTACWNRKLPQSVPKSSNEVKVTVARKTVGWSVEA
jgi:hypothetical protein